MQDGFLSVDMENLECHILDGPESHGSRRIVKVWVDLPGEGGNWRIGWKVRRKEASELRCLTVKDIFKVLNNTVEEIREDHSIKSRRASKEAFGEVGWCMEKRLPKQVFAHGREMDIRKVDQVKDG